VADMSVLGVVGLAMAIEAVVIVCLGLLPLAVGVGYGVFLVVRARLRVNSSTRLREHATRIAAVCWVLTSFTVLRLSILIVYTFHDASR
jgi:hypothetical protein